ncbi:MAG: metallophosphoesterase [Deltaproteobacteria bacterium]|nr:metallophosphoesterase [Deltaproteobacteria bacterium]
MRLVYVVDLHGDEESYEASLRLALEREATAIVNGGDLLPHAMRNAFAGQREFLGRLRGYYARVREAGLRCFAMFGNDDARALVGGLDELDREGLCRRLDGRGWLELGAGWSVLGFPWVPDPPFRLKDWCRHDDAGRRSPPQFGPPLVSTPTGLEERPADWVAGLPTLEDELAALSAPPDPERALFVMHGPPTGIGLDVTGDGRNVGSRASRRFLEACGWPLALHGHIHESPHVSGSWFGRLGRTTCVNPGAMERPSWVLVDLERRTLEHCLRGTGTF